MIAKVKLNKRTVALDVLYRQSLNVSARDMCFFGNFYKQWINLLAKVSIGQPFLSLQPFYLEKKKREREKEGIFPIQCSFTYVQINKCFHFAGLH